MRGNLAPEGEGGGKVRSIPAYAGEPYALTNRPAGIQVYPRVCGGTSEPL